MDNRSLFRRAAVVVALVLSVALVEGPAMAHHQAPIQPGAQLNADPGLFPSTLAFVYRDGAGAYYIGAAAHALPAVGSRVGTGELKEFGTVVYRNQSSVAPCSDAGLIRIDADKVKLVDPSVRRWGGPTGVQTNFSAGQVTLSYGQAYYVSQTEAGRASVGVLRGTGSLGLNSCFDERWFLAVHPAVQGDSGSPVLTGDGKALGVMTYVQTIWGGTLAGMTVQALLAEYRANGFPTLELVTAPFRSGAREVVDEAVATAQHCAKDLQGEYRSEACVRTELCLPVDPAAGTFAWTCADPARKLLKPIP